MSPIRAKVSRPLVLLDRDGTLIAEKNYLHNPRQIVVLPGVINALKRLRQAGFPLVVVSNQSGLGRGLISRQAVERVNRRFVALLRSAGVRLNGLFWCPHGPGDGCRCRKPNIGLVQRAAQKLGVSWRGSISVGDKLSDVALGLRTGGRGILVLTGFGREAARQKGGVRPDYIAKDFRAAARWILTRREFKQCLR